MSSTDDFFARSSFVEGAQSELFVFRGVQKSRLMDLKSRRRTPSQVQLEGQKGVLFLSE